MKLKDYRETYYLHSGKASDIARQLGFAGIALIWAFKIQIVEGNYYLPPDLFLAGILIVIGLALDLLQYVSATIIWGSYSRYQERRRVKPETKLDAPRYFNWPALAFFWGKIGLILGAYATLLRHLCSQLAPSSL